MSFWEKFFGYTTKNKDGYPSPFLDNAGKGPFLDYRHYILLAATVVLCIFAYFFFRKYKKAGKITMIVLAFLILINRISIKISYAVCGVEPYISMSLFPFHMCAVMIILLPLTAIFNWKKLKPIIYTIGLMGGVTTLIIAEYFEHQFLPFDQIESIIAHMVLILIPIIDVAIGNFKFEIKKCWQVILVMPVLLGWATLANRVFFKDANPNYMYLDQNGLPGNIGGKYYFLIYIAIFFALLLITMGIPSLYRYINQNRKKNKFPLPKTITLSEEDPLKTGPEVNIKKQVSVIKTPIIVKAKKNKKVGK